MDVTSGAGSSVNPHFLGHLAKTAAARGMEASEDILAGNGMKLLAKGARVDQSVRERLLEHKLSKPLEQCLVVSDAIQPASLAEEAARLIDRHPFLAQLCAPGRAQSLPETLGRGVLSASAQSLLTIYAGQQPDRLEHALTVCLIAVGAGRQVLPGDIEQHRALMTAGLLHDIGELYIDPALLVPQARLAPEQWRHIVTHPLVGGRVLSGLEGVGKAASSAVAQHHERLDGFGYPRGLGGDALSMPGQILAAAEWLAGLLRTRQAPLAAGSIGAKLMPGDFPDAIVAVLTAGPQQAGAEAAPVVPLSVENAVMRMSRIGATLQRFAESQAHIEALLASSGPAMRRLLTSSTQRMARISRALSSTGLAPEAVERMFQPSGASGDPQLHAEIAAIVTEVEWRLRELERESLLQAGLLSAEDDRVMRQLIGRLTGQPEPGATAAATPSDRS